MIDRSAIVNRLVGLIILGTGAGFHEIFINFVDLCNDLVLSFILVILDFLLRFRMACLKISLVHFHGRMSHISLEFGDTWIHSVQVVDDLSANRVLWLQMLRQLFSRALRCLTKVHDSNNIFTPALAAVNHQVLRKPLSSLLPELFKELVMFDFFDAIVQTFVK